MLFRSHTQAHYQLFLLYSRTKQSEKAQGELAEFKKLEELDQQAANVQRNLERVRRREAGEPESEEPTQPAGMGQPATLPPPPPGMR